jgi:rhodanese-related sulfurtransferase
MTRNLKYGVWALVLGVMFALSPSTNTSAAARAKLEIKDITEGAGAVAVRHSLVQVHYTGWLMDGSKFDSSRDRNNPFEFTLGGRQVIRGWDQGVEGMKVGGKRELTIPPHLGYGQRGAGGDIPPGATLKFEIELLAVTPPGYANIDNAALKSLLAKGAKIVDLRRPDEWRKSGFIKGSLLLTAFDERGKFARNFPKLLKSQTKLDEDIILICQQGNRSAEIANALVERVGYTKIHNVTKGIAQWIKEGNPTRK